MTSPSKVIYDFGMNHGDNIEYYLLKGLPVVAVEANRALCAKVEKRFADAIGRGQLTILNVALSDGQSNEPITFHVHRTNDVLSQLPEPSPEDLEMFEPVSVQQRTPSSIIREFGEAHYIKVDVEHFDGAVLAELFSAKIFPDFISAESHNVMIFALLVANGYESFNLLEGATISLIYGNAIVQTAEGARSFRFRHHSAGPFGEDIASPWYGPDAFFYALASARLGWKDIHASKVMPPEIAHPPRLELTPAEHLRDLVPSIARARSSRRARKLVSGTPGLLVRAARWMRRHMNRSGASAR